MHTYRLLNTMRKYAINFCLALLLLQASCAAQQTGGLGPNDTYSEDLTGFRPKFEADKKDSVIEEHNTTTVNHQVVAATQTVNAKVDMVMDSLDRLNQLRKFIDGFTIQIYSGPNREEAIKSRSKMVQEVSDLEASIQYTQPKFRVTVGQYFSKLEAQKDLNRLRKHFSNAILVPEKIQIK